MLSLPTRGVWRSVEEHNVQLDTLCDWIEGSVLFQDERELPAAEIVSALCESKIYDDQDFAWEIVQYA
jgi:hypothetical protein